MKWMKCFFFSVKLQCHEYFSLSANISVFQCCSLINICWWFKPVSSSFLEKVSTKINNSFFSSTVGSLSSEDHDFDPTAEMLIHEYDDERTLEEEELLNGQKNFRAELADLERVTCIYNNPLLILSIVIMLKGQYGAKTCFSVLPMHVLKT